MPLVELCLQVKLLSLGGIKQFLSKVSSLIFHGRVYVFDPHIFYTLL